MNLGRYRYPGYFCSTEGWHQVGGKCPRKRTFGRMELLSVPESAEHGEELLPDLGTLYGQWNNNEEERCGGIFLKREEVQDDSGLLKSCAFLPPTGK